MAGPGEGLAGGFLQVVQDDRIRFIHRIWSHGGGWWTDGWGCGLGAGKSDELVPEAQFIGGRSSLADWKQQGFRQSPDFSGIYPWIDRVHDDY